MDQQITDNFLAEMMVADFCLFRFISYKQLWRRARPDEFGIIERIPLVTILTHAACSEALRISVS